MAESTTNINGSEIAVISMSGRFPGARNIDVFWENIKNGIESISFASNQEILEMEGGPKLLKNPDYVKSKGGVLDEKECFDAAFFGFSPKEAEVMNPQIRVFLECTWHTLENAGYVPENYDGLIGLYAGAGTSLFWEYVTLLSGKCQDLGYFAAGHLNNKDYLPTQVAYKLNLKGPAFSVQTACSTSLVAIHLACQGLLNGECDMALAGGVSFGVREKKGYVYQEGMINSPDGHCRAFDARGKGTVTGEGAGVVLLKPLQDALDNGDPIYAVIKGTAINNDGLRKIGYSAPSIEGQAEVIRTARQMAEVEAESFGYIEAHGTATELGDPVEIEALKLAFNTEKKNYCGIGSVKTNIGHLDAAAGVAGFIKTVLALKHKQIPPSLHFETPNPRIDFKNSPFYVNNRLNPWETNGCPRRAGVSSFGIGGTNAHVVLEEWVQNTREKTASAGDTTSTREYQLLLLSAKTPAALDRVTENLAQYLRENNGIPLADAAYTLAERRKRLEFKRMAVCKDVNNTIELFSDPGSRKVQTFHSKNEDRPVIFMFAGLGSQYLNMGRELYEKEPVFRNEMNRCSEILEPLTGYDIKNILYPGREDAVDNSRIREFETGQLVIFCFEYALTRLILDWGLTPDAMIGYSFGEYTAAAISGVFSLEDALKLIVSRGKLIAALPHGAMLSIPMTRGELEPMLSDTGTVSIAIDNGPTCIVAGIEEDIKTLENTLKEKKFICFPMGASHAIHTQMMAPILPEMEQTAAGIPVNSPRIPYISNLTGKWQTVDGAASPSYWARHMAETVRFNDGIKELLKKRNPLFIEIGPGRDLSAMVGRYFSNKADHHILNLVRPAEQDTSDLYYLLNKFGRLWLLGQRLDWHAFNPRQSNHLLPLPAYPFEKQRYWINEKQLNHSIQQMAAHTDTDNAPQGDVPVTENEPDQSNHQSRPQLMNPYAPPRNKLEQDLTGLWQDLFGYGQIGIDDNFMELGGDSLTAIKMTSLLKETGAIIALKDVLANQTIRQLASFIGERMDIEQQMADIQEAKLLNTLACIEKLNNGHNERKIFMVHPAHGMLVQYYDFAKKVENNFNVYGIQARGILPGSKLAESPEEMAADYVEQILKVQPEGPYILTGYCTGVGTSYEMALLLESMNHKVEHLIHFNPPPIFSPNYEKALKKLANRPAFFKKFNRTMIRKRFNKAKLKRERSGDNSTSEDYFDFKTTSGVTSVKNVNKKVFDHLHFFNDHTVPLAITNSPLLVVRPKVKSEHSDVPDKEYSRMTYSHVTLIEADGDHDTIWLEPNVEGLAKNVEEYLIKNK